MTATPIRKYFGLAPACLAVLISTLNTSSCSPGALKAASQAMEDLNTFVQNKTLAEQFVRDIKASVDPSEPVYARLLESYNTAKNANNRLLDEIEAPGSSRARAIRFRLDTAKRNAEQSLAAFLDSATRTLRPAVSLRNADLKRVTARPDNLVTAMQSVPKAEKAKYVHKFDSSVRWSAWNAL
jgi:hypothetical protein